MKKLYYSRSELYDQLWQQPIKQLALELGLSDVALAKNCKALGFPLPPRGYWAQLRAGGKPRRPELPPRPLGEPEWIRLSWLTPSKEHDSGVNSQPPPEPKYNETLEEVKQRLSRDVSTSLLKVSMSPTLPGLEKLLADDKLRGEKWRADGSQFWNEPYFTSKFEKRRFRIINTVLCALQKRGGKPSIRGKDPGIFRVEIGAVTIELAIDEAKQPRNMSWHDRQWRSHSRPDRSVTDKLMVEIHTGAGDLPGVQLKWVETDAKPIEECLSDVVVNVLLAAEAWMRASERWRYDQYFVDKAEAERKAAARAVAHAKAESDRKLAERVWAVDELRSQVADANFARDVRHYVASVKDQVESHGDCEVKSAFVIWSEWATAIADRIDPVLSLAFVERTNESVARTEPPSATSSKSASLEAAFSSNRPAWDPIAWYRRNR